MTKLGYSGRLLVRGSWPERVVVVVMVAEVLFEVAEMAKASLLELT
jgi:hypothetical protein